MTKATTFEETQASPSSKVMLPLAWLAVGIPLLWGVAQTIQKAALLFR